MRRAAIAALLISRLALAPALAASLTDPGQIWSYGESKFVLEAEADGQIRVVFHQPRPGLVEEGVTRGTLLFDGKVDGTKVSGQSRLFRKECGVIAFKVSGTYDADKGKITLTGRMPRRDEQCNVESRIEAEIVLLRTRSRVPGMALIPTPTPTPAPVAAPAVPTEGSGEASSAAVAVAPAVAAVTPASVAAVPAGVAGSGTVKTAADACPACRPALKACLGKTAPAAGDSALDCYREEEAFWSRTFLKKVGESGLGEAAANRQLSYIVGVCAEGDGRDHGVAIASTLCRIDAMARTVDGLQAEPR